jgi:hypothetical protein
MRKISLDIAHAFKGGDKRSISNTSTDGKRILLHGNTIASWNDDHHLEISMCGWGTPTTRERINTIFYVLGMPFKVFQKDHGQFLKHDKGFEPMPINDFSRFTFYKQKDIHSFFDTNQDVWHVKDMGANHEYIIRH